MAWEDSEAGKALKAKGHDFLRKPREDTSKGNNCMECLSISSCDTCHAILNFLNNNPSNLPFINAILFSQEKRRAKEKEGGRKVRPHEARPFLDTGASGDFISMEFADFLIKENFKIEKLNSSCNVSLASHDNCLKAHNYIKFELEIIDEFGTSDKLEIKGVIVPIKYGIIIGLPTIKRHNLTYRYPTIFSNEKMQEELLCKPCNLETSEGDGNLHARRVVTSSTYPKEAIESEEGVEPVSDSEHPVRKDKTESPSLEEREGKRFEKLGSPVIWWNENEESAEIAELSSNFSSKLSFEIDDLSERKGAKIEAIPEEMLRAEEEDEKLPDLRHLQKEQRERVEGILKDFKDLFRTRVAKRGANVTPFELKVNPGGWRISRNRGRPRRMSHSCKNRKEKTDRCSATTRSNPPE